VIDRNQITASRERFVRETEDHVMTILHDEDLYRHLRFQAPGTLTFYFDLITWPGHLAVVGDCGDFLFARTRDMFDFFGPTGARRGFEDERWGINPDYWSEKLKAPGPDGAERYSYDTFRQLVLEWFADISQELQPSEAVSLREALDRDLLSEHLHSPSGEHEAHRLLSEFDHGGTRIYESWEWRLREYDWSFLWCCWAIVWGIKLYRDAQEMPR
jgi:hypothetical protein